VTQVACIVVFYVFCLFGTTHHQAPTKFITLCMDEHILCSIGFALYIHRITLNNFFQRITLNVMSIQSNTLIIMSIQSSTLIVENVQS
jgi:hypothetical protein